MKHLPLVMGLILECHRCSSVDYIPIGGDLNQFEDDGWTADAEGYVLCPDCVLATRNRA